MPRQSRRVGNVFAKGLIPKIQYDPKRNRSRLLFKQGCTADTTAASTAMHVSPLLQRPQPCLFLGSRHLRVAIYPAIQPAYLGTK